MAPPTAKSTVQTPTLLAKEQTLKEHFITDESDRAMVAYNEFSDDIPVISMAGIDEDYSGERRKQIVKAMTKACEDWGIFQLVDHGVDTELISQMTKLSKEFFALTDEEKLRFEMSPGPGGKGGFRVSSHLQDEVILNWRELMLFFTYPVAGRDYSKWPTKPQEWRAVTEAYSEKLMDLSHKVLEILSEGLGLEKGALRQTLGEENQHLVINHYPKCPQPELTVGLKRHTDPSTITLLFQDTIGGLQATRDDGKTWITVRPIDNAFVVNLGDHAYFVSNGRFKTADHQAVVNSEQTRMSVAVFLLPEKLAKVYPIKLQEGEKSVLEEPITFAEMTQSHAKKYLETLRIKKLAKEENWSTEKLNKKLRELA